MNRFFYKRFRVSSSRSTNLYHFNNQVFVLLRRRLIIALHVYDSCNYHVNVRNFLKQNDIVRFFFLFFSNTFVKINFYYILTSVIYVKKWYKNRKLIKIVRRLISVHGCSIKIMFLILLSFI